MNMCMCVSVSHIEFTNFTCTHCMPSRRWLDVHSGWMSDRDSCVPVCVCIPPYMLYHPLSGSSVAVGADHHRNRVSVNTSLDSFPTTNLIYL